MNYKYKNLKKQDCASIVQSKNHGVLSICDYNKVYSELVFYDIDCFCNCFNIYFNTCKCGTLMDILQTNNEATLFITYKCNNYYETVSLDGTLEIVKEDDCCCKEDCNCFETIKFTVNNMSGKRYCKH